MKKIVLALVVLVAVTAVIGIAKASPAWIGAFASQPHQQEPAPLLSLEGLGDPSQQFESISITESGVYYLGGICAFEVEYKSTDVRNDADNEVPVEESKLIPYASEGALHTDGELFIPGCHIVHYKQDKVVREASLDDGNWRVCFGERPDVNLVIYFYYDDANPKTWIALPTTHENGLACAQALYTGEYAPASEPKPSEPGEPTPTPGPGEPPVGSVVPPPTEITITGSGTYSAGGICTIIVEYKKNTITDVVHVQDPINRDPGDWDTYVPFPDPGALLYQPGCHVIHYENGEIVRWEQGEPEGSWTICFAARPDKEMTIYYYLADLEKFNSPWQALPTTVENGKACAPAQFTGMYTPAGK